MLYLELGVTPARFIIKSRRLNFLKHILDKPSDSLIFQFLDAQFKYPTINDWGQTAIEDLKDMVLDMSAIKEMSKNKLKHILKEK